MNTSVFCLICHNENGNTLHRVKEMMFGSGDVFLYMECASCHCLQLVNPPDDPGKYYPRDYYSLAARPRLPRNSMKRKLRLARDHYAVFGRGWLGRIVYARMPNEALAALSKVQLHGTMRILDVGCGSGGLLFILAHLGFQNLSGIDPHIADDAELLDGKVRIEKTSLSGFHKHMGAWDMVMMHHSLEHMPDPQAALHAAAALLKPGGMLLIRTPTVSSYAWKHYGPDWFQIDAPRHNFIHSIESMRHLAEATGFEVSDVIYDSSEAQFLASEQYRRGIPLKSERSYRINPQAAGFSRADIREYRKRAAKLNAMQQGDQAAFYLRKRSAAPSGEIR
ncbi:MAG: class I SAM-dependent methyltransferase [Kiritimatiellae bacterium]|nr:class I SAM-dependent methyltransferase [Kiritimatiellia bacterium]